MTKPTIEIRYIRKFLVPFLIFATIFLIIINIYVFFSDEYENNNTAKIMNTAGFVLGVYLLFGSWRTVLNKKPVLVFTDTELKIFRKNIPTCLLWNKITSWKIEKLEDSRGYMLSIETDKCKEKISLNWLDKPPQEIEKLMAKYIKRSDPISES